MLGSTSPAFMLGLALFCKVIGTEQINQASLWFNSLLHFIIVIFAYLIGLDLCRRTFPAICIAVLIGVCSVNVYMFSQGFEAAMLLAVLLAALYLVRMRCDRVAVLLASLAPLVRPEGILLSLLVWGCIAWHHRFKLRLLIWYFPIPIAWIVFSTSYYGSVWPHAIEAKRHFPAIYRPFTGGEVDLVARLPKTLPTAAYLWTTFAEPLTTAGITPIEFETTLRFLRRWFMLLGLPCAIVVVFATRGGPLVYLLYPPLFLLLYGWIGHTQMWYFPSLITFVTIILFFGWVRVIHVTSTRFITRVHQRSIVSYIATTIVFLIFLPFGNYCINRGEYDYLDRGWFFPQHPAGKLWDLHEAQRHKHYATAAEFLNLRASLKDTAMISEVGVFGYYFKGEVIDSVGLCSPEALDFYPPPLWDVYDDQGKEYTKANNFTPTEMVLALKPDYLVNSRYYIMNLLHNDSTFLDDYREIHRFGRVWGEPLLIFERIAPK